MLRLTASIVVYRTPPEELAELFRLLERDCLSAWVVVDNAASEDAEGALALQKEVETRGGRYLASPINLGFGGGHNMGLSSLAGSLSDYHLILNPDILYEAGTLQSLQDIMDVKPGVGLVMPKIVYPGGEWQPLCKLLPTPIDFALRRFAPRSVQHYFAARLQRYEMPGIENKVCDKVPFLSGCFMFTRAPALQAVGGFDERYFLYMEDVDLCRRLRGTTSLLYWPNVTVSHGCYRGAYRNRKLMWIFIQSAVRYFNRWGWVFDRERRTANQKALSCLR